uniref:prospero homeobox protein 1-like n=1 Tax=Pristiophorus japonicus TaxID=55135 RepID=UPI00398E3655
MEQSGLPLRDPSCRDGAAGDLISRLLRKSAMEAAAGGRELSGGPRGSCWSPGPEEEEEEDDDEGSSGSSPERQRVRPSRRHLDEVRPAGGGQDDDDEQPRAKRGRVRTAEGGVLQPPGALPGRRGVLAAAGPREPERRRLKRQLEALRRQIQHLQGRIGRASAREAQAGRQGGSPGSQELGQALKAELGAAMAKVVDAVVKMFAPYGGAAGGPGRRDPRPGAASPGRDGHGTGSPPARAEALPLVVRRCPPEETGPPGPTSAATRPGAPGCGYARPGWPRPLPWPVMAYAVPGALAGQERAPPEPFVEMLGLRTQVSGRPLPQPLCAPRRPDGPSLTKTESLDLQDRHDVQVYGAGADGLSPGHLKKAKLIFLYSRYPSSNTLKTYFPDVKFNRCITSQLIKWFSNFREFFYIQVEKFARQALSEGASSSEPLLVNRESDLFRTLNQHYNKSSEFEVPDKFLEVSQTTLQEFFDAIVKGRDVDPSWKKHIYKVISKLDSEVPEIFKCPSSL